MGVSKFQGVCTNTKRHFFLQKIVIFVIYRSFGLQKRLGSKNFVIPPTLVRVGDSLKIGGTKS